MALDWLGSLSGSASEGNQRLKDDAKQRASEAKKSNSIILSPKDILSGKWDAGKVLITTMGGSPRPITNADLKAFQQNIKLTQNRFTKGVTATQVINLSGGTDDMTRAISQITSAIPVGAASGKVRFITNASKDSDVNRHHVMVEFLGYQAEASSGLTNPRKAALRLRRGILKFDCDCGRHRYWFRYISTIGGYNAGRAETGFPKIRNPNLKGIACKHVIRVMSEIERGNGSVVSFLTRLMEKAKTSDTAKASIRMKQEAAEKAIKNIARRTSGNNIQSADQRRIKNGLKKAKSPTKVKNKSKPVKSMTNEARIAELVEWGVPLDVATATVAAIKNK